ncbi:MAG: hypothetical protein NTU69_03535 [Proteobacteria bacterium]|jgi:hypothetical protein|nr:hypothetical protein [Pseudomonadota bacterium]
MRIGRVFLKLEYVVDLDNKAMVEQARDILYDDIIKVATGKAVDDIDALIKEEEDKSLSEDDISPLLLEEEWEEEDE